MFRLHEKVVYPGQGVAVITRIVTKIIQNKTASFFELKLINKERIILVPVDNALSAGIRQLSSVENISSLVEKISKPYIPHDGMLANWNKRNKEYLVGIRSGDLLEIGEIYRKLKHMQKHKELSFGEKSLLEQTEEMLVQEIALVKNMKEENAVQFVRSLVLEKQVTP
jgi:CarD family transcriptional regulator